MTGMTISQWKRTIPQLVKLGHTTHALRVEAYANLRPAERKRQLHLCSNPNLARCNHGRG